jgi:hypothetical protein
VIVEAEVSIRGSKPAVWTLITDIEHAAEILSGVQKIEILERPARGLVGLKWRETRILFGEPAAVVKWITEAVDHEHYRTRAEDSGFVFLTTMRISEGSAGVTLTSSHETKPQGLAATLKSLPMFLFKGVVKKAILQDLTDVKAAVERKL